MPGSALGTPPELELPPAPAEFEALAEAVRGACSVHYHGDPSARPFRPSEPGPHKLVFIAEEDGTAHALNNVIPKQFRPDGAAEIELAACVQGPFSLAVGGCKNSAFGSGATFKRKQQQLFVRLIDLRFGWRGSGGSYLGEPPPACPTFSFDSGHPDVFGPAPSPDDVERGIIDRYVRAPDCGASRPYSACLQCWRDAAEARQGGCAADAEPIELSDRLKDVALGQSVELYWNWYDLITRVPKLPEALSLVLASAIEISWSSERGQVSFSEPESIETVATPMVAGPQTILAKATLPGPDGDVVKALWRFNFECVASE